MEDKVNYIQAINFTNLFHTRRDEWNSKYEAESRKTGLRYFGAWISFILSQNVNHAFLLDHL